MDVNSWESADKEGTFQQGKEREPFNFSSCYACYELARLWSFCEKGQTHSQATLERQLMAHGLNFSHAAQVAKLDAFH